MQIVLYLLSDNTSLSAAINNIPRVLHSDKDDARRELENDSPRVPSVDLNTYVVSQLKAPRSRPDAANILLAITDDDNGGIDSRHLLQTFSGQFDYVITIGVGDEGPHGMTTSNGTEVRVTSSRHLLDIVDSVASMICPKST